MVDLAKFFNEPHCIRTRYLDHEIVFFLREPSTEEYLLYRRQCGDVTVKNNQVVSSAVALNAPLKLFDVICTKIVIENGGGEEELPEDSKASIPDDLKLAVIGAWQNRFQVVATQFVKASEA